VEEQGHMKETQLQWIVRQLEENGEVSRNQALTHFISRLSARIADLELEGYKFSTEWRGGDYVYTVISTPKPEQLPLAVCAEIKSPTRFLPQSA
jgi:hypothetical protein